VHVTAIVEGCLPSGEAEPVRSASRTQNDIMTREQDLCLVRRMESFVKRRLSAGCIGVLSILLVCLGGCSRGFWRRQADRDVYNLLAQKTSDPRWNVPRVHVRPDPRSRLYDSYDLDHGPLPPDDPAAGQYLLKVAGKRGYKSWHKFGRRFSIENPHWLEPFGLSPGLIQQVSVNNEPSSIASMAEIKDLTIQDAVELSYIHSRDYQSEIENVYLRALELTFERFQFDVRYLGLGAREPTLDLEHGSTPNGPNNLGLNQRFGVSQLLPSGGQFIIEMANNTLWLFSGPNAVNTSTVLSYSLVQPLLFQAGRKIALENLTQSERNSLYAVRDLARFRKEFFTDVVAGPSGFLSVLRQAQLVENERDNIRRVREQLELQRILSSQRVLLFSADLEAMPAEVEIPASLLGRLIYDEDAKRLYWRGEMTPAQAKTLLGLSADPAWRTAVQALIQQRVSEPLEALPPDVKIPPSLAGKLTYSAMDKRLYWQGPMTDAEEQLVRSLSEAPAWRDAVSGLISRLRPRADIRTRDILQLQSRLLGSETRLRETEQRYRDLLDRFKILIGLPPNMKLSVDLSLLQQFQLIDPNVFQMEQDLKDFVLEWAKLDERNPEEAQLKQVVQGLRRQRDNVESRVLELVANDLKQVRARMDRRLRDLSPAERRRVEADIARDEELLNGLSENLTEVTRVLKLLEEDFAPADLQTVHNRRAALQSVLGAVPGLVAYRNQKAAARNAIADLRERLLLIARNAQGIQVGLRVELLTLQTFELSMEEAVQRALTTRLDLKNARARVMDARRRVEVAANRLEAVLNLRVEGDVRTPQGNNPLDFRGRQSNFRVGVGITAPLDLVNERNAYRDAQIAYQQARRAYMALEDQIKLQVRASWRDLDVLRKNFETARQRIRVSASEFDITVEFAQEPAAPGQRPSNQNTGLNLLNALNNVLNSQNDLIRIWVDYERSRLNIHRDIGIMEIDEQGLWNDPYYQQQAAEDQAGTSHTRRNGPLRLSSPLPPASPVGRSHELRPESHRRRNLVNSHGRERPGSFDRSTARRDADDGVQHAVSVGRARVQPDRSPGADADGRPRRRWRGRGSGLSPGP